MKRFYLFSLLLLGMATGMFAQKVSEGSEKSPLGSEGKCLVIELEANSKNVEDVLEKKFKKLKHSKTKGYHAFEAQVFPEISSNTLDIYYKVDGKGDDKAKVVMFMSTGYDNWLNPQDHSQELSNAKEMLQKLVNEVRIYELTLAIEAQTKVLEDATKEQEGLVKDHEKLVKDHEDLLKEIEENKKDTEDNMKAQEAQKKVIEEEKKLLDELQKKLGSVK